MNPYVKQVRPLEDYQLEVIFENGERRIFDVKPYLKRGVLCAPSESRHLPGSPWVPWSGQAS